jgi:hypothetical protein
MTERTVSGPSEPQLLPKLHAAREAVDKARWELLDAVILLNDLEEDILAASQARLRDVLDRIDLTGPNANAARREADEYRPTGFDPEDWRPEDDCV